MSSRISTRVRAENGPAQPFTRVPGRILQRKCACGGPVVAGGECAECRKKRLQRKLAVNQPGDHFEQEADRMADLVVGGGREAPVVSSHSLGTLQREDPKTPPKPDNYDEAIDKILDALKKTPVAKELQAKAAEMGKDFISSVEGKVIAGSALGGALAAIIATNSKLPMQIPELPLDFIAPGLKAKITWEGSAQSPTNAGLVLTTKGGVSVGASYTKTPASGGKPEEEKAGLTLTIPLGGSSGKKKGGLTAAEKYRAETARIAAEQEKFRQGMKTPGEKTEDKDFVNAYVRSKVDPTNPLGLPPLKKKEDLLLMRKAPNESLSVPETAPPVVDDVLAQTGQPLDRATRSSMEARFGYNFSHVRVHSDARANASARSIHAHAYTVGENIVFDAGRFAPHTHEGRRLLAHELTHVVQQGAVEGMLQRKINIEDFEGGDFDMKTLESYLAKFGPGKIEDHNDSDDKARTIVKLWRKGKLNLTPEKKILLIQEMQSGFTGDDDERAILTLLFNSSDAELQVIFNPKNGIDPKDLDSDFQGPEEGELRGFYDRRFEGGRAAALKGSRTLLTETAEEKEKPPGDILRSLSFKSDHGVLQDNNSDWSAGVPYGEPEWFVSGDNKVVSKPISQTMGTSITAEATLNLLPATAAAAPITLRSESLDPYLQFRFSGTMQGGTGQIISLSSVGKLPAQVTSLRDRRVRWHMKWHDSDHEIGLTKHTIFVTMGTPFEHEDGAITHKRMAKAVEIMGNIRPRTLDPHEIAEGIMRNWNQYSLEIPLHKPIWTFADTVAAGGQCVDIVRFVRAIIQMVGCPGTPEAVVIWADPTAPSVPQENNWGGKDMRSVGPHALHGNLWKATLLDGDWHGNSFEAALKFNHGGKVAYYPGGARGPLSTPLEVLHIFKCVAWIMGTGGLKCRIMEVPGNGNYPRGPCPVGSEHECFVKSRK